MGKYSNVSCKISIVLFYILTKPRQYYIAHNLKMAALLFMGFMGSLTQVYVSMLLVSCIATTVEPAMSNSVISNTPISWTASCSP